MNGSAEREDQCLKSMASRFQEMVCVSEDDDDDDDDFGSDKWDNEWDRVRE